ncbi:unnamed protein product [Lactuca virosa]|uniref:Uncharacterized protein n=1 Tax=Lactuca virosa TaxID=75947 RepID=A0AAU9PEY0_9ASTR|nr:unnamed protein product [Lactuca virosa]
MWFSDQVRKETSEADEWSLRQWLAIVRRGDVDLRRALIHSRSDIKTHMEGRQLQSPIKGRSQQTNNLPTVILRSALTFQYTQTITCNFYTRCHFLLKK